MPQKSTLSFRVSPQLVTRFREATREYYGKAGVCFSAALLMFMEADPKSQGEFMKRILDAELNEEVEATVAMALERQAKRIRSRKRRGDDEA